MCLFSSHRSNLLQIDDPFKKLGPLAIFSAKRHWTVPRSVCLKKAANQSNIDTENVVNSLIRPSDYSSESASSSSSVVSDTSDGLTLRNLNRRNMEFAEEYGFKLRGDSPVIISVVVPNSLADVSWPIAQCACKKIRAPNIILLNCFLTCLCSIFTMCVSIVFFSFVCLSGFSFPRGDFKICVRLLVGRTERRWFHCGIVRRWCEVVYATSVG